MAEEPPPGAHRGSRAFPSCRTTREPAHLEDSPQSKEGTSGAGRPAAGRQQAGGDPGEHPSVGQRLKPRAGCQLQGPLSSFELMTARSAAIGHRRASHGLWAGGPMGLCSSGSFHTETGLALTLSQPFRGCPHPPECQP